MQNKIPTFLPKPSFDYMDFDIAELIAAAYNWCETGAQGLEYDAAKHPEESEEMLAFASACRKCKDRLAEAYEAIYTGELATLHYQEEERKIRECMAL